MLSLKQQTSLEQRLSPQQIQYQKLLQENTLATLDNLNPSYTFQRQTTEASDTLDHVSGMGGRESEGDAVC